MTGETVAIIPARGGSKGVVDKNLRTVGGIPLVARTVRAALATRRVDRVVVTTDDARIAATTREWGGDVIDRPAHLAGDAATSESAVLHALDMLAARDVEVATVAFLQPTSPFIDPADLDDAIRRVVDGERDVVFSAVASWGFLWRETGGDAVGVNHDRAHRPRRQDREPEFFETGAFYVFDAAGFRAAGHRFFGRVGIAVVPERRAIEIDTEEQLEFADALAPLIDREHTAGDRGAGPDLADARTTQAGTTERGTT